MEPQSTNERTDSGAKASRKKTVFLLPYSGMRYVMRDRNPFDSWAVQSRTSMITYDKVDPSTGAVLGSVSMQGLGVSPPEEDDEWSGPGFVMGPDGVPISLQTGEQAPPFVQSGPQMFDDGIIPPGSMAPMAPAAAAGSMFAALSGGSSGVSPTVSGLGVTADGTVISPTPEIAQAKYDALVNEEYENIVRERQASGMDVADPQIQTLIRASAEQRARFRLSITGGGSMDNLPKGSTDWMNEPIYKAGQTFASYTQTGEARPLSANEAEILNWVRDSGQVPESENVLATFFDPMIDYESKQDLIAQMAGAKAQLDAATPSIDQGIGLSWNPLTWTPGNVVGGLLTGMGVNPQVAKWADPMRLVTEAYEKGVDPSFTYALSALPGGPRTVANWDEARSISGGQMAAAVLGDFGPLSTPIAPLAYKVMTGDWASVPLDVLGLVVPFSNEPGRQVMAAGLREQGVDPMVAQYVAQYGFSILRGMDPKTARLEDVAPWISDPNAIYDAQFRRQTFQDSPFGSAVSGSLGATATTLWDPLNLIGVPSKLIRVSHRLGMGAGAIRGARDLDRERALLDIPAAEMRAYDDARVELDRARNSDNPALLEDAQRNFDAADAARRNVLRGGQASASVQFLNWLGEEGRTLTEVLNHSVVKGSNMPGGAALALLSAKTYEQRALTYMALLGDPTAWRALRETSAGLARRIEQLQVQTQVDNLITAPEKFAAARQAAEEELDAAIEELNRIESLALDSTGANQVRPLGQLSGDEREIVGSQERLRWMKVAEGNREIDRLMAIRNSAKESGASDATLAAMDDEIQTAIRRTNDSLFGDVTALADNVDVVNARMKVLAATERYNTLYAAKPRKAEDVLADEAELLDMIEQNEFFRVAYEAGGAFVGNRVNVGRGRLQGAARWRESARQARAERRARQMATHRGGLVGWVPQTFKAASGDEWIVWGWAKGARAVVADALTRPLTYATMESPAGYIKMAGIGATDNQREIQAMLFNLRMYADPKMQGRRERILASFVSGSIDPSVPGPKVLLQLEQDVLYDMARYYRPARMTDDEFANFVNEIRLLYGVYDSRRASLIKSIMDQGYWVDENGVKHTSPFLESQLLQGMPMMDFRLAENIVSRAAKRYNPDAGILRRAGKVREADEGYQIAQQRVAKQQEFVDATDEQIFRTLDGDTVAEIRAQAANGDKAAAQRLVKIERLTGELASRSQKLKVLESELEKAMDARTQVIASPSPGRKAARFAGTLYDEFERLWRAGTLLRMQYAPRNTIDGAARSAAYEASFAPLFENLAAGTSNTARNVRGGKLRTQKAKDRDLERAKDEVARTGVLPRRVQRWRDNEIQAVTLFRDNQIQFRDEMSQWLDELQAEAASGGARLPDELVMELNDARESVRVLQNAIDDLDGKIARLNDDSNVLVEYRRGLDQKRKIGSEAMFGVDGRMYWGFRGDPVMGPIMAAEASARETVQATLGLRLSTTRSTVNASMLVMGGKVEPSAKNYFTELTIVLNKQLRNSIIGKEFLAGNSPADAARRVMTADGARFRQLRGIETYEDALMAVEDAYREFGRYLPSPELRRLLAGGQVTEVQVKELLMPYVDDLVPVHGSEIGQMAGSVQAVGVMQKLNAGIDRMYNILSTIPEDNLVRLPFAQRRFKENVATGTAVLVDRFGDRVPAWATQHMLTVARRRAIKETKDILYTQDRRTNFGRVFERVIPFVSASQNTYMAWSKLIAMNPDFLWQANVVWQAPNRMGIEDERGNLHITLPESLAPLKVLAGGSDEFVYNKSSVYVIPQQIDPVMTIQGSPLIQVTASELMKRGLILKPTPPAFLVHLFGQETANWMWKNAVQRAVFGTQPDGSAAAMSSNVLSYDKVLPPPAQKMFQLLVGSFAGEPENERIYAYYYQNTAMQELFNYMSGERDSRPTRQEIESKTNWQYLMRISNNLLGTGGPFGLLSNPLFTNDITRLVQVKQDLTDTVGQQEADRIFLELFGDEVAFFSESATTASAGGMNPTMAQFARAEEQSDLIGAIAPKLSDARILAFLLGNGQDSGGFDNNIRVAQLESNIPGTNRTWRETLGPGEQTAERSRVLGWQMYGQMMDAITAELNARDLGSLESRGAADLKAQRDAWISAMATDWMYYDWYNDYKNGAETRLQDALNLMRAVSSDTAFMDKYGQATSDMWMSVPLFLTERRRFKGALDQAEGDDDLQRAIREAWSARSLEIAETSPRFMEFFNRYLAEDTLSSK